MRSFLTSTPIKKNTPTPRSAGGAGGGAEAADDEAAENKMVHALNVIVDAAEIGNRDDVVNDLRDNLLEEVEVDNEVETARELLNLRHELAAFREIESLARLKLIWAAGAAIGDVTYAKRLAHALEVSRNQESGDDYVKLKRLNDGFDTVKEQDSERDSHRDKKIRRNEHDPYSEDMKELKEKMQKCVDERVCEGGTNNLMFKIISKLPANKNDGLDDDESTTVKLMVKRLNFITELKADKNWSTANIAEAFDRFRTSPIDSRGAVEPPSEARERAREQEAKAAAEAEQRARAAVARCQVFILELEKVLDKLRRANELAKRAFEQAEPSEQVLFCLSSAPNPPPLQREANEKGKKISDTVDKIITESNKVLPAVDKIVRLRDLRVAGKDDRVPWDESVVLAAPGGGGKKSRRKRTKRRRTTCGKKSRKLRKRRTIKGVKRKRRRTRRRR